MLKTWKGGGWVSSAFLKISKFLWYKETFVKSRGTKDTLVGVLSPRLHIYT